MGLLLAAKKQDDDVDLDGLLAVLVVLGRGTLVAGLTALALHGVGRVRGSGIRPLWSWALVPAALALPAAGLLVLLASVELAVVAAGIGVGGLIAAYSLHQAHRDDIASHRPERRSLSRRRIGPIELVDRTRARRHFERGPVPGLSPTPLRRIAGAELPTGISLGRDERGFPAVISQQQLTRSALITGTVGSGKTMSAQWIVSRMLRGGFGAIWTEAKADPEMRDWLMPEVALRGVPFREFSIAGAQSMRWNPLASAAGPVERRDLVFRATASNQLEGSPEYFIALFKQHALVVLKTLRARRDGAELAGDEALLVVRALAGPAGRRQRARSRSREVPRGDGGRAQRAQAG